MDFIIYLEIGLFVFFLSLSAFFSSSETSLFSLNALTLEQMRRDGNPRTGLINRLLSEPRRLIVTILIGNELVNVAASVISAAFVIRFMGSDSKWINLGVMVPLLLLFGEITPKTLAIRHNVAFASVQSVAINAFAKLITPVRWIVRNVADGILKVLVGGNRSPSNIMTEDMVRSLTEEAVGEGTLDRQEARFIDKIFNFGDLTVEDIMTPRSDMFTLKLGTGMTDMAVELHRTKHTKVPVVDGDGERIVGNLYARDLLGQKLDDTPVVEGNPILRKPYIVPGVKPAADLFQTFQKRKISMALVIDEYGGCVGLVTLEDLLECIFGDIHSGSEAAKEREFVAERLAEGDYQVDAAMSIKRFNMLTGASFSEETADTLGGFILNTVGELPPEGSSNSILGVEFTVLSIVDYRITKIRARFPVATKEQSQDEPTQPDNTDKAD